jgi:hypothetical protein
VWTDPEFLAIGMVCAMCIWLFVAVFHLRRDTHTMSFSQREQFIAKTTTVLQEMGYALSSQQADRLTYRPRFHSYLFGGAIDVALADQEATLTGPKVALEIYRRCFRVVNHVQRVQLYLQEHRKFTENVIKRLEVRLRLSPDQLNAVRKNVIGLLEKDGTVTCELKLLVQSEKGIRADLLETQVRDWLQEQGIDCDMHKGLVQFVELPQLELESANPY